MNKYLSLILVLVFISISNAQTKKNNSESSKTESTYLSVGKQIDDKNVLSVSQMTVNYQGLKLGDTLSTKMTAKVDEVCQMKGCWMTLNLENGEQVRVRFKDYGFFVPKDISGKDVIINGLAFLEETSVDNLRHYAEDAGKSEEEIAAITSPKNTFSFEADGVLIKE